MLSLEILQIFKESLLLGLCTGVGAIYFKRLNDFLKIHFFQILLAFVTYIVAYLVLNYQQNHNLPQNNQLIYNLYIVVDAVLVNLAVIFLLRQRYIFWYFFISIGVFIALYIIQLMRLGLSSFANYAFMVSGISITIIYLVLLFKIIHLKEINGKLRPEFWLIIGVILYFTLTAPYLGLIHYLYNQFPAESKVYHNVIIEWVANIRYLLAIITIWLYVRKEKQPHMSSDDT